MLKIFRLALKLLWREWRAGEWFISFFALLLSIIAITTLHFYIDRVLRGFNQQSATFLGGDLVISSPSPIPLHWQQKAKDLNLKTAFVWTYPSVVSANEKMQLVNLQAVSSTYPLLGEKKTSLLSHESWVEPRILSQLSIKVNDSITIGTATFRVTKILTSDIDTLNTGWTIAPRILLRLEDIPATKTILVGSRVDYRMLITGDTHQLKSFREWVKPLLKPGQHLLDVNQERFILYKSIHRIETYLQLVLLVCLSMSGIAIFLSTQQYLRRHYSHIALWRCLGAKKSQILHIFVIQFLIISFIAGILGIGISYFAQEIFANIFNSFLQISLPPVNLNLSYLGLTTSALLLFAFAYPIISDLPMTPPMFIWRNEKINGTTGREIYFIISIITLVLFIYWLSNFSNLSLLYIDILLLSIGFLYAFSIILLRIMNQMINRFKGTLRQGLNQLIRHPESTSIQLTSFSLIVTLMITLATIRTDLINDWRKSLPKNTPNYFAINIAPTDVSKLRIFFQQQNVFLAGIYPIVRGRLFAINGKPIMTVVPPSAYQHNALHRELNLSSMLNFPDDNIITNGKMWTLNDSKKPYVSVEKKLAEDLQLRIGDQLSFQIGDQILSATIFNFRSIDWESFHPNFYMIFTPHFLDTFPSTYITSFYLNPNQTSLLNQIISLFPNITILDIANILNQVQILIAKMSSAIQYLFLFALGSAILIFIASIETSMDERRQTYYLFRILGASKKYIYQSLLVEFTCLFLLIFTISFILAKMISILLIQVIFNI